LTALPITGRVEKKYRKEEEEEEEEIRNRKIMLRLSM